MDIRELVRLGSYAALPTTSALHTLKHAIHALLPLRGDPHRRELGFRQPYPGLDALEYPIANPPIRSACTLSNIPLLLATEINNLPLNPNILDPTAPDPRDLLLHLPRRQAAPGAIPRRPPIRRPEHDVRDAPPAQRNTHPCAVLGKQVFELVVADERRGGAVDVDAEAVEHLPLILVGAALVRVLFLGSIAFHPSLLPKSSSSSSCSTFPFPSSRRRRRQNPLPRHPHPSLPPTVHTKQPPHILPPLLPQSRRPHLPPPIRLPPIPSKRHTPRPHAITHPLPPTRPAAAELVS